MRSAFLVPLRDFWFDRFHLTMSDAMPGRDRHTAESVPTRRAMTQGNVVSAAALIPYFALSFRTNPQDGCNVQLKQSLWALKVL
jgi:hypothetical protein